MGAAPQQPGAPSALTSGAPASPTRTRSPRRSVAQRRPGCSLAWRTSMRLAVSTKRLPTTSKTSICACGCASNSGANSSAIQPIHWCAANPRHAAPTLRRARKRSGASETCGAESLPTRIPATAHICRSPSSTSHSGRSRATTPVGRGHSSQRGSNRTPLRNAIGTDRIASHTQLVAAHAVAASRLTSACNRVGARERSFGWGLGAAPPPFHAAGVHAGEPRG